MGSHDPKKATTIASTRTVSYFFFNSSTRGAYFPSFSRQASAKTVLPFSKVQVTSSSRTSLPLFNRRSARSLADSTDRFSFKMDQRSFAAVLIRTTILLWRRVMTGMKGRQWLSTCGRVSICCLHLRHHLLVSGRPVLYPFNGTFPRLALWTKRHSANRVYSSSR